MQKLRWTLWWRWLMRFRSWRVAQTRTRTVSISLLLSNWYVGMSTRIHYRDPYGPGHTRTTYVHLGPLCLSSWKEVG